MQSDSVAPLSPLKFSSVWTTQMALLFTVVLSACPSRISQSRNPLFIPTEAQSVCKWTWVMADRERLASPPIQASHAVSDTDGKTHAFTLSNTRTHKDKVQMQTTEKGKRINEGGSVFFPRCDLLLSLFSLRFYVMSPCKKSFMVFPGLVAMSAVRWIAGALELLQDQHLVRVTREHLQRALACKLGNSLIWLPLQFLLFFLCL